ncbi:hypothetical protein FOXYS1_5239 [Fusarium oxysporum]|uniref:Uncharacterized protein n=1 Tax=Fusarium oxysporum TaxID=5507 RepID=A0A8H5AF17_FUSOX|nr:hypothetical protein FOXYS1_5239 [Fusarium oxysporum]
MHYLRRRKRMLRLRKRRLRLLRRMLRLRGRTFRLRGRTLRLYKRRLFYQRLGFRHMTSMLRKFLDEKLDETIRLLRTHEEKIWKSKRPTNYRFDSYWRQEQVIHNDITITLNAVSFSIEQFFSERGDIYDELEMDVGSDVTRPEVQRWRRAFQKRIFGGGKDCD